MVYIKEQLNPAINEIEVFPERPGFLEVGKSLEKKAGSIQFAHEFMGKIIEERRGKVPDELFLLLNKQGMVFPTERYHGVIAERELCLILEFIFDNAPFSKEMNPAEPTPVEMSAGIMTDISTKKVQADDRKSDDIIDHIRNLIPYVWRDIDGDEYFHLSHSFQMATMINTIVERIESGALNLSREAINNWIGSLKIALFDNMVYYQKS